MNSELSQRKYLHVPFTLEPKRKMRVITGTKDEIRIAVAEAEFFARALESKKATPDIRNTVRAATAGACLYVAKALDTHQVDAQLVRDIYPYARVLAPQLGKIFESFVAEMQTNAPRLYKELVGK